MKANLRDEYKIDSLALYVLDNVLSLDQIADLAKVQAEASYCRSESDRADTRHIQTFASELDLESFRSLPLFTAMNEAVRSLFPGETLREYRSYCNSIVYGDIVFSHRDCDPTRPDVTALYYANSNWEPNWAGETIFFNNSGDAICAVAPKPGRLVVFRGALEHRVGVPSRLCTVPRLTIACKFKGPGEWH